MDKDPLDNHLVNVPHKHFAWIPPLTLRQRQASYWWVNKRMERGLPIGCWGIYRWLSEDGVKRGLQLGVQKIKMLAAKRFGFNNLNLSASIIERCEDIKKYNRYRNWCYRNFDIPFEKWAALSKIERTKLIKVSRLRKPRKSKASMKLYKPRKPRKPEIDYVKLNVEKFKALGLLKVG